MDFPMGSVSSYLGCVSRFAVCGSSPASLGDLISNLATSPLAGFVIWIYCTLEFNPGCNFLLNNDIFIASFINIEKSKAQVWHKLFNEMCNVLKLKHCISTAWRKIIMN